MTAAQAVEAGGMKPTRKLFLRLDDGSLIGREADLCGDPGSHAVVRITVDRAAELGRVSDKEVARLQAILERLKQQGVHLAPPAALAQAPSKKARLETMPSLPAAAVHTATPWQRKCREVFTALLKHLGPNKHIYYNPVDPAVLPDYYNIIKEPLFLREVDERLSGDVYAAPAEFVADIKHHFQNVRLYNPEGDPFRTIGNKAEEFFDQLWAGTGLSQERVRRTTAGLAAPKFDPERFEPPAKPKAARSHQGTSLKRTRDGHGVGQHEVTSGGQHGLAVARPSEARIVEMGAYLSREDLPAHEGQHFMSLLPPHMLAGIESGEVELDFSILDDETLGRIDMWLRSLPHAPRAHAGPPGGGMYGAPPPMHQQPSVRVDSYEDDDYEGEESYESD